MLAAYPHVAKLPTHCSKAAALQVLHIGRVKRQKEINPDDAAWIDMMCQQERFFVTPYGSNDDWYWMYAAVAAGSQGRLISNDEMRDHVFQLLAPRYFYKWKQRHQVNPSLPYLLTLHHSADMLEWGYRKLYQRNFRADQP